MSGAIPAGYEEYIPKNHPRLTAPMMPSSSSVYNFSFNKDRAEWQAWSDTLPSATIPAGSDFSEIIVPTQDSARYTFLLDTALRHTQPILFVGPTGQFPSPCPWLPHPAGIKTQVFVCRTCIVLQRPTHCSFSTSAHGLNARCLHTHPVAVTGDASSHVKPGFAGTGKSTYINRHLVQGLPKESWAPIFLTFSARTTANMAQEQVGILRLS